MDIHDYCRSKRQQSLATDVGVTQGALSRWINGHKKIPLRRAIAMLELGIELESIKYALRDHDYDAIVKLQSGASK